MKAVVSPIPRAQSHELLNKLEAAGLISTLAQRVIDSKDNELAKKVVRLIANGSFGPSASQERAREIMGRNFFGVEEAILHFGVNPSEESLAYFSHKVPWSEEVLTKCKDTHILIAVFPMSILDIRGKATDKFYTQDWYNKQTFAKNKGEVSWQLVRKTPVENSTDKTWDEQQTLLLQDEVTPSAQVMVYTIIGHFLATGERLFEKIWARCSDLDSDGDHVDVGLFVARGLRVYDYWDGSRRSNVGVSAAKKF
jgi:hypothetical protein